MTTTEVETVEVSTVYERVNRGAAYLDEREDGWLEKIDLSKFSIQGCFSCIIGQVIGDYCALDTIGIKTREESADHGYTIYPGESFSSWGELETAWTRLITQRRSGGESFLV